MKDDEGSKKSLIEKLASRAWKDPKKWWITPAPKLDRKTPSQVFFEAHPSRQISGDLRELGEGCWSEAEAKRSAPLSILVAIFLIIY